MSRVAQTCRIPRLRTVTHFWMISSCKTCAIRFWRQFDTFVNCSGLQKHVRSDWPCRFFTKVLHCCNVLPQAMLVGIPFWASVHTASEIKEIARTTKIRQTCAKSCPFLRTGTHVSSQNPERLDVGRLWHTFATLFSFQSLPDLTLDDCYTLLQPSSVCKNLPDSIFDDSYTRLKLLQVANTWPIRVLRTATHCRNLFSLQQLARCEFFATVTHLCKCFRLRTFAWFDFWRRLHIFAATSGCYEKLPRFDVWRLHRLCNCCLL